MNNFDFLDTGQIWSHCITSLLKIAYPVKFIERDVTVPKLDCYTRSYFLPKQYICP